MLAPEPGQLLRAHPAVELQGIEAAHLDLPLDDVPVRGGPESTEADRRRFGSTLPNRLPSLPSGSMRNAGGNERKTIIYVAREGHRIPRDEPE